jgi:hypothetical protein
MRLNDLDEQTHMNETEQNTADIAEVAGEVRALRAIVLELANPELIADAKINLRNGFKNSYHPHTRDMALLKEQMNLPFDKHAEAALDQLLVEAKSKQGSDEGKDTKAQSTPVTTLIVSVDNNK